MPKLLTTKELQQFLGVSRDLSYQLMRSKGFPAIKLGAKYYVDREQLIIWIERYSGREFVLSK